MFLLNSKWFLNPYGGTTLLDTFPHCVFGSFMYPKGANGLSTKEPKPIRSSFVSFPKLSANEEISFATFPWSIKNCIKVASYKIPFLHY